MATGVRYAAPPVLLLFYGAALFTAILAFGSWWLLADSLSAWMRVGLVLVCSLTALPCVGLLWCINYWLYRTALRLTVASIPPTLLLQADDDESPAAKALLHCSALQVAALIRSRAFSCSSLIEAAIARVRLADSFLNAVCEGRFEAAVAEATAVDGRLATWDGHSSLPLFLGVPLSVKDQYDVGGMRQSFGSAWWIRQKRPAASQSCRMVAQLQQAGFIVLCKTSVPEFMMSDETWSHAHGTTVNPHAFTRTPGGSSGGEAALIAAGASLIGLGTDGAGSVRQPALFTGVFGHKPSAGLTFDDDLPFPGKLTRSIRPLDPAIPIRSVATFGVLARHAVDLWPAVRLMSDTRQSSTVLAPGAAWLADDLQQLDALQHTTADPNKDSSIARKGEASQVDLIRLPVFSLGFAKAPSPARLELRGLTVYSITAFPNAAFPCESLRLAQSRVLEYLESTDARCFRHIALPGAEAALELWAAAGDSGNGGVPMSVLTMGSSAVWTPWRELARALVGQSDHSPQIIALCILSRIAGALESQHHRQAKLDRVKRLRQLYQQMLTGELSVAQAWKQYGMDDQKRAALFAEVEKRLQTESSQPIARFVAPSTAAGGPVVLLLPLWSRLAVPHHTSSLLPDPYTAFFNMLSLPATQVPTHLATVADSAHPLDPSSVGVRLPVGCQLAAAFGRDDLTIGLAIQLERAGVCRWQRPSATII